MQWNLKHQIKHDRLEVIHWVTESQLAIATRNKIQVYKVNAEETIPIYSLVSDEDEWDPDISSLAANGANPDAIYVTCLDVPYVYQFPCHASTQYAKKHTIVNARRSLSIAANADTAVIGVEDVNHQSKLVVCSLPDFSQQRSVNVTIMPRALCIASHYLLVKGDGESKIQVKSRNNMNENVQTITFHEDMHAWDITLSNDAKQMYVACSDLYTSSSFVLKYTWHGKGTPAYVKSYCSIHVDFGAFHPALSLSSAGVLAILDDSLDKVNIYALEWITIISYDT